MNDLRVLRAGAVKLCVVAGLLFGVSLGRAQEDAAKALPHHGAGVIAAAVCFDCHFQTAGSGPPAEFRSTSSGFCGREEASIWQREDKHRNSLSLLLGERNRALTEQILGFKLGDDLLVERWMEAPSKDAANDVAAEQSPRLVEARFAEGALQKRPQDVAKLQACFACHAPLEEPLESADAATTLAHGVSCQACHGGGEKYRLLHTLPSWRLVKADVKQAKFGMQDLRNPHTKAQLCASCHVGQPAVVDSDGRVVREERFVNHEWYAAGHPPLPSFEAVTFAAQAPAHWQPTSEKLRAQKFAYATGELSQQAREQIAAGELLGTVAATDLAPNYLQANEKSFSVDPAADMHRSKELLVSGLSVLSSYAALLEQAGDSSHEIEFAYYDCYACHHELRANFPSANRAPRSGSPGRPPAAAWPTVLAKLSAKHAARLTEGDGSAPAAMRFEDDLQQLQQSTVRRPFGDPEAMQAAAIRLRGSCDALARQLAAAPFTRTDAELLLAELVQPEASVGRDYHSARQSAWAIREVLADLAALPYREIADQQQSSARQPTETLSWLPAVLGRGSTKPLNADEARTNIASLFDAGRGGSSDWLVLQLPAGQKNSIAAAQPGSLAAIAAYDDAPFRERLQQIRAAIEAAPEAR